MRKLSAELVARRDALVGRLAEARVLVESVAAAHDKVVDEIEALRDEVVAAIDEYVGARSDKWQAGERAERYLDWRGEWEDLVVDKVDVPIDAGDEIAALPVEVG